MIRFVTVWTLAKALAFRPLGISMKTKSRLQRLTIKAVHIAKAKISM